MDDEAETRVFIAGSPDDPQMNFAETLTRCLTCGPKAVVAVHYNDAYWVGLDGSVHSGHTLELGRIEPSVKLTVKSLPKDLEKIFTPTPEAQDYESDSKLYDDCVAVLKKYVDLPGDIYYSICALFALATWRVHQATVATYLNLLAPHGSGKSTLLKIMRWLCANSIHSMGATRGAIIRAVDGTNASLLLDEADLWLQQKDWDNPIMAVLNAGYQRGTCALMCEPDLETKGYKVVAKDPFGFKIIAGRNPLVTPLASRCITIAIRKSNQIFPKLDVTELLPLRGQLHHYGETRTEPLTSDVSRISEPRLREIMEPLLACAPSQTVKDTLLQFVTEEEKRRDESEYTSIEAEISRIVIHSSKDNDGKDLTELGIRTVANVFNEDRNLKEQWKNAGVARILQRLGFQSRHTRNGNMIQLKTDLLAYLKTRYNIADEVKKATQERQPESSGQIKLEA